MQIMDLINNKDDFIAVAENLIENGQLENAYNLLKISIKQMPFDWKPYIESDKYINIFFWNKQEFLSYVECNKENFSKVIYWNFSSYSKAHYLLAYILIEQENYKEALVEIENGLALEPDHPKLLCEKAYILNKMGNDLNSLSLLQKAENSRLWITSAQKTHTLREQSIILSNLDRLEEAETTLTKAMLLSPNNKKLDEDFKFIKELQLDKQKIEAIKTESETYNQLFQNIDQIFQEKGEEGIKEWLSKLNKQ